MSLNTLSCVRAVVLNEMTELFVSALMEWMVKLFSGTASLFQLPLGDRGAGDARVVCRGCDWARSAVNTVRGSQCAEDLNRKHAIPRASWSPRAEMKQLALHRHTFHGDGQLRTARPCTS